MPKQIITKKTENSKMVAHVETSNATYDIKGEKLIAIGLTPEGDKKIQCAAMVQKLDEYELITLMASIIQVNGGVPCLAACMDAMIRESDSAENVGVALATVAANAAAWGLSDIDIMGIVESGMTAWEEAKRQAEEGDAE